MMTPYHVLIAPLAKRQILSLPPKLQKLVLKFIAALAINPRPPGATRIEGMTGLYSQVTLHPLRLIYKIEDQEIIILIATD